VKDRIATACAIGLFIALMVGLVFFGRWLITG
jgi:hypothetical protein